MSLKVLKHIDGYYEVGLTEPEEIWIGILAGKLMCDDITILNLAIERGLVEFLRDFVSPKGPEEVT